MDRRPAWVPDLDASRCQEQACQEEFTLFLRRHHCRNCGKVFCGACTTHRRRLRRLGYSHHVRVCDACFLKTHSGHVGDPESKSGDRAEVTRLTRELTHAMQELQTAQTDVAARERSMAELSAQLAQATAQVTQLRLQLQAEQDRVHAMMNARERELQVAASHHHHAQAGNEPSTERDETASNTSAISTPRSSTATSETVSPQPQFQQPLTALTINTQQNQNQGNALLALSNQHARPSYLDLLRKPGQPAANRDRRPGSRDSTGGRESANNNNSSNPSNNSENPNNSNSNSNNNTLNRERAVSASNRPHVRLAGGVSHMRGRSEGSTASVTSVTSNASNVSGTTEASEMNEKEHSATASTRGLELQEHTNLAVFETVDTNSTQQQQQRRGSATAPGLGRRNSNPMAVTLPFGIQLPDLKQLQAQVQGGQAVAVGGGQQQNPPAPAGQRQRPKTMTFGVTALAVAQMQGLRAKTMSSAANVGANTNNSTGR